MRKNSLSTPRFRQNGFFIFVRYPQLFRLGLLSFMAEMGYSLMLIFALPLYLHSRFESGSLLIGTAISVFLGTEMLLKPVLGHVSDRIGRKPLMLGGMALSTLTPLLIAATPFSALIILLRAFDGAGAAALRPSISVIAAGTVKNQEKIVTMSIFNVIYLIASGAGLVMGSILLHLFQNNFFLIFYFISILFLGSFLLVLSTGWGENLSEERHEEPTSGINSKVRRRHLLSDLLQGHLPALYLMGTAQMLGITALTPIFAMYVTDIIGLSQREMPFLFLAFAVGIALLAVPLGHLADAMGKRRAVVLGGALASLGMWLLPSTLNILFLLPLASIIGIGFVMAVPAWLAGVMEMAPQGRIGAVIGLLGTAQGAGAVIGPLLGGYLRDVAGFQMPFYLSALLLTLTTLLAIIFMKNRSPLRQE